MINTVMDQASGLRKMKQNNNAVKVISVTGGKGGVGKTNASLNIAIAMGQQGKRVLVLDADLGLANCDVMLGLRVEKNLSHVLSGECELEDILVEGCKRFVSILLGILVVFDDDDQVKGVIGQRQMLKAIGNGVNVTETTCKEVMEMDVLKVPLTDAIADVIKSVNERMPQAVVAVNEEGSFEGYFSPEDYRQAQSILSANPSLGTLE
jgi:cellulose biosynthesis protein BcsQ